MKLSSIAGVVILLAVGTSPALAQRATGNFVITGVNLTNFQIVGNTLTANGTVTGTLAGLPFTTNITNFVLRPATDNPATPATECAILNLELGPINLALLGLFVDTSEICLEITATEGGGLLGNLLCSLAGGGLLGTGVPIIPTGLNLDALLGELVDILNGSLGRNPRPGQGNNDVCSGQCDILNLVLGPLDLSLLGLNVRLDDCDGGPVQVCISASRGAGILGDLLCSLTGPQLLRLDLADITRLITRALQLNADGLSRRDIAELTALLGQLLR